MQLLFTLNKFKSAEFSKNSENSLTIRLLISCHKICPTSRVVAAVVVVAQRPWLRISGNCYSTRQLKQLSQIPLVGIIVKYQGGLYQTEGRSADLPLRILTHFQARWRN